MKATNRCFIQIVGLFLLATLSSFARQTPTAEAATDSTDTVTALSVRYDTSQVMVRSLSKESLDRYYNDSDFDYDRSPKPRSLWEEFKLWLLELLRRIFHSTSMGPFWSVLPYVIVGVVVVLLVLKLLGVDVRGVVFRKPHDIGTGDPFTDEDIHDMDFDALITAAVAQGDYRRAVRLHYLQLLKRLSDRELIHWRPEKTNHDYVYELAGSPLRDAFARVTYVFEYTWYGDFTMVPAAFEQARQDFIRFDKRLTELA